MSNATPVAIAHAADSLRGRSRDDVLATLGPATVIRFDSGHEVWVYRFVEPAPSKSVRDRGERHRPASELVMLFTPSGVVAKVRARSPG